MLLHNSEEPGCRWRILGFFLLVVTMMFAWSISPARADFNDPSIKVMTQNMDAGTDLGFFFYYASQGDPVLGAQLTYQEITTQSQIPGRAQRLALEIALEQPDLISLQEVTNWGILTPQNGQTKVLYDQLDLLLKALSALRQHYDVVTVQSLTLAYAPLDTDQSQLLLFNDRNVILARSDAWHSFTLSNVQTHIYSTLFGFSGFQELMGWISVDVKMQGKQMRLFSTHLTSPEAGMPDTIKIQVAQADELIQAMNSSSLPVVLAGDFNSDAEQAGIGPDQTPTAAGIAAAGYTDTWHQLHPRDRGFTWPIFSEDVYPITPIPPLAKLNERIDLIYERDLKVLDVDRVFHILPPWASDHLGVVATLRIDR